MKYFALLTQLGEELLAQATIGGTKLELTQMAVGDGGGKLPTPDTNQTKLIAEKRRAPINTLWIDENNKNQIIAEQIIPENEGGWWVREIGLFDKAGNLIAVANSPETYKPKLVEGSGRTLAVRIVLIVSHTDAVTLKVDPSVVLATREYVDSQITIIDKKLEALAVKIAVDLNKKFDKANISSVKGNDNDKVPSLNLFTTETGKLATKGDLDNKVAKTQTINGVPMNTQNIAVTAQTVLNQYALLDDKSVLHAIRSTGIYVQSSGAATTTAKDYPFNGAQGVLLVFPVNNQSNVVQTWLDANGSQWRRAYNHPLWTTWAKTYDSENKPTAADIGAVDTSTGEAFSTRITNAQNTANLANKTANSAQTEAKNANENAEKRALKTTTVNGYLLSSNILLATKDIFKNMTELGSDNLSNIFAPGIYYQKSNASALWSRNYPKDGVGGVLVIYRTNQGATTANNACVQVYYSNENIVYTRVYNGSSWAGGWATQVNTATGMTNVRLGTKTRYSPSGNTISWNWEAPAGNVLTGLVIDDTGNNSADNVSGVWYRPLQYYINGSWLTAESL